MASLPTNNQFRINLADGWQDRTVHYFMGPEEGGLLHSLTLTVDEQLDTDEVAEYARERIDHAIETMPAAELLKEEEKTLPNGVAVYEALYKWVPPEGKATYQKLVYMIRDGVAYTFSANFTKKTLKTLGAAVDEMIRSFEPLSLP